MSTLALDQGAYNGLGQDYLPQGSARVSTPALSRMLKMGIYRDCLPTVGLGQGCLQRARPGCLRRATPRLYTAGLGQYYLPARPGCLGQGRYYIAGSGCLPEGWASVSRPGYIPQGWARVLALRLVQCFSGAVSVHWPWQPSSSHAHAQLCIS